MAQNEENGFSGYLKKIKERSQTNRIYSSHQMIGLMIADILGDQSHKALYMRLAKNNDKDLLMSIAKTIADNQNVKNKGAYFMKVWKEETNKKKTNGSSNNKRQNKIKDTPAKDALF